LIAIAADRATSKRYRSAQEALEMAESFTAAQMYELGTRHASIEARGDIDGTMATLVEDPVYELLPIGLAMRGREQVLRYYENLIGKFIPMTVGYELLEEWVNETSVCQEYRIEVEVGSGSMAFGKRIALSGSCTAKGACSAANEFMPANAAFDSWRAMI
jgi:hypothetical protein